MRKLMSSLGVAALVLAAVSASAQNQRYAYVPLTAIPATLAAGTTNFPGTTAPVLQQLLQQNVAVSSIISAGAPGATNIYYFAPTVDFINFDTNNADCFSFTNADLAGNVTNVVTHTWNIGGYGGLRLSQIVTTGTATNGALSYGSKISCP